MSIHSPVSHDIMALQAWDTFAMATIDKHELSYNRFSPSELMKKSIVFPNPPRPPTPGPPGPNPPMPPNPPGPTPPPSPQYLLSCGPGQQPSLLASQAGLSQCPHPNPPPSPGPRRPGPFRPRPDVPTPPPSPYRAADPWIFSIASNVVEGILMYLTLATWDGDTASENPRRAPTDVDMCFKRHSENPPFPEPTALPRERPTSSCQQHDLESPRVLASLPELRKQGIQAHDRNMVTTAVSYTITTALSEDGSIVSKLGTF